MTTIGMTTVGTPAVSSIPDSFKAPAKRDRFTQAYWAGLREHKFMLQTCKRCKKITHPPGPLCSWCLSNEVEYKPASGLATVYAFTVSHRPLHEEFRADLPYIVALVDLEEGVRIMTWIKDCKEEDLKVGMKVEVFFEQINDEVTLHRFRPVSA